jgi:hypothetical protein
VSLTVAFLGACSPDDHGADDTPPPATHWRTAPLRIEPGPGEGTIQAFVVPDAKVSGHGRGWLLVEGEAVYAVDGALGALDFEADRGGLRVVADSADVPALPDSLERDPGPPSFDAREIALDRVTLTGYDRAALVGSTEQALPPEIVVDGRALLWDEIDSRIFELDTDTQSEVKHTSGFGGVDGWWAAARARSVQSEGVGEPCEMTTSCDEGLQCIGVASNDGSPPAGATCQAACVQSDDSTLACVDDDGCCDPEAMCSDQGRCVDGSGEGGGGGGGSSSSGCNEGCGDDDDDGVINKWDRKPQESCKADADDDGCNDSCDANDMDSSDGCESGDEDQEDDGGCFGFGGASLRDTNSTFWSMLLLIGIRGRRRSGLTGPKPTPN